MRVTIELPQDVAEQLQHEWGDISRHILESIAAEGYRSGQLTALQVQERTGVWRDYAEQELENDYKVSRQAREGQQQQ